MAKSIKYTLSDVGCYADGTFGQAHLRARLAELIHGCDEEVIAALKGDSSDDCWEEDAALDLLNEHTSENCSWTFEQGDLLLVENLMEFA